MALREAHIVCYSVSAHTIPDAHHHHHRYFLCNFQFPLIKGLQYVNFRRYDEHTIVWQLSSSPCELPPGQEPRVPKAKPRPKESKSASTPRTPGESESCTSICSKSCVPRDCGVIVHCVPAVLRSSGGLFCALVWHCGLEYHSKSLCGGLILGPAHDVYMHQGRYLLHCVLCEVHLALICSKCCSRNVAPLESC